MPPSNYALGAAALTVGLGACGLLGLAVVADYWLYTSELLHLDDDQTFGTAANETGVELPPIKITMHSGLWRACLYIDGPPEDEYLPAACFTIGYSQVWSRVDGGDTTNSILRGIRKAAPLIVVGLLVLVLAVTFSTLGNAKTNAKTLVGAVMYIFSALFLGLGMIFYISAVNDEVSRLKEPEKDAEPPFVYRYGWAVYSSGTAFVVSMVVSVINISLFLARFRRLEDMVQFIPGLNKKTGLIACAGDGGARGDDNNIQYNNGPSQPSTLIM